MWRKFVSRQSVFPVEVPFSFWGNLLPYSVKYYSNEKKKEKEILRADV